MHKVKFLCALSLSAFAAYVYASALQELFAFKSKTIIAQSYGGLLQFLTNLGILASLFHQIVSVLSLLTGLRTLCAIQNALLIISAPLEFVISFLYWPLKFSNPSLLLDKRVSQGIGPSLDRRLHLYPAIFQFLSATVLAQKPWRSSILGPACLMTGVAGGYWWWFETTARINGFYPYPFLALLTTNQKLALVTGSGLVALGTYKVLQNVQRLFI